MSTEKETPLKADRIKLLNPEKQPLTVEKLRELSGLQLTDEEAEEMVHSIHLLAKLLDRYVRQYDSFCIDNEQVVNLEDNSTIQNKAA